MLSSQQAHACMAAPSLFPLLAFLNFEGRGNAPYLLYLPLTSCRGRSDSRTHNIPTSILRRNLVLSILFVVSFTVGRSRSVILRKKCLAELISSKLSADLQNINIRSDAVSFGNKERGKYYPGAKRKGEISCKGGGGAGGKPLTISSVQTRLIHTFSFPSTPSTFSSSTPSHQHLLAGLRQKSRSFCAIPKVLLFARSLPRISVLNLASARLQMTALLGSLAR